MAREEFFCTCLGFVFWYTDKGIDVCQCGHPAAEHLDNSKSCTGLIWIDLSKGI